jgi:hypothetical protein
MPCILQQPSHRSYHHQDLLNPERFWHEELTHANKDRLFGCSFRGLDSTRSGGQDIKVQGLIGDHAYSVLRAVECNGKKFIILRNPWGDSEWTGRWSDGSKEWTHAWLELLPQIGHAFGDDGQFIMECTPFSSSILLTYRHSTSFRFGLARVFRAN